ncbi:unnamed protein product, partial [Rangifer tarandus platyrhynchus]
MASVLGTSRASGGLSGQLKCKSKRRRRRRAKRKGYGPSHGWLGPLRVVRGPRPPPPTCPHLPLPAPSTASHLPAGPFPTAPRATCPLPGAASSIPDPPAAPHLCKETRLLAYPQEQLGRDGDAGAGVTRTNTAASVRIGVLTARARASFSPRTGRPACLLTKTHGWFLEHFPN